MTKKKSETYVDLDGREWDLTRFDDEERRLVARLQERAGAHADWNDFDRFWPSQVAAVYDVRGLSRQESMRTGVYQIAQDISSRLALASGHARESDYRDELKEVIRTRFKSRRAFCEATGLSEDMLSHVLAGRKNLALETLIHALQNIGYRIRIVPATPARPKKSKRTKEVA
ncbi:MAG: hypothetical protein HYR84_08340 [Planctomycetes bacterium]|nr:hypothetical protein [Planctomycetota bacterium]